MTTDFGDPLVHAGLANGLLRLKASQQDDDWFAVLGQVESFMRLVARDHLCGEDLVDDVVQESCLRMRTAVRQFRGHHDGEARAWIRSIVRHTAVDALRSRVNRRRRERVVADGLTSSLDLPEEVDPHLLESLRRAIQELPDLQSQVIHLRYNQALGFSDIADQLGLRRNHVHVLHKRALDGLKQYFNRLGYSSAVVWAMMPLLTASDHAHRPCGNDRSVIDKPSVNLAGMNSLSLAGVGVGVVAAVCALVMFVPIGAGDAVNESVHMMHEDAGVLPVIYARLKRHELTGSARHDYGVSVSLRVETIGLGLDCVHVSINGEKSDMVLEADQRDGSERHLYYKITKALPKTVVSPVPVAINVVEANGREFFCRVLVSLDPLARRTLRLRADDFGIVHQRQLCQSLGQ